jgi:hypothetical protein
LDDKARDWYSVFVKICPFINLGFVTAGRRAGKLKGPTLKPRLSDTLPENMIISGNKNTLALRIEWIIRGSGYLLTISLIRCQVLPCNRTHLSTFHDFGSEVRFGC